MVATKSATTRARRDAPALDSSDPSWFPQRQAEQLFGIMAWLVNQLPAAERKAFVNGLLVKTAQNLERHRGADPQQPAPRARKRRT